MLDLPIGRAWVLGPRGTTSLDPVRAAVLRAEFHQWRQDRDAWFVDNGIAYSWHACYNERRRRAAAWQETHPEDRGRPSGVLGFPEEHNLDRKVQ